MHMETILYQKDIVIPGGLLPFYRMVLEAALKQTFCLV